MPCEIGWVFERIGWVLELVGFLLIGWPFFYFNFFQDELGLGAK